MDAHIARLCVLYEDLRLELLAIAADSIPPLDILDPLDEAGINPYVGKSRRNYFLRRSIGTLHEFAEGVRLVDTCAAFSEIKAAFDGPTAQMWDSAATFFRTKEAEIKQLRNDVGGHFGSKATIYAVLRLSPDAVGFIEIVAHVKSEPGDFRLRFVGEIAATAFMRHLLGSTSDKKVGAFFTGSLMPGFRHATECVQVIAANYLWHRFGR